MYIKVSTDDIIKHCNNYFSYINDTIESFSEIDSFGYQCSDDVISSKIERNFFGDILTIALNLRDSKYPYIMFNGDEYNRLIKW